jgi:hypothetical protein
MINALDSALALKDMSLKDIWLSNDYYGCTNSNLKFINSVLSNPLSGISLLKSNANYLQNLNENNLDDFCSMVFSEMQFKDYQPFYYAQNLSAKDIDRDLNLKIDYAFGMEGGYLIRQYITEIIQINALLSKDFLTRKGNLFSYLFDKCDSVLLPADIRDTNIFVEHYKKVKRNEMANNFFNYAKYINYSDLYAIGMSLYKALLNLSGKFQKNLDSYKNSIKTRTVETVYGRIALGGAGDDTYNGDYVLIVDIGGNDTYNLPNYTKEQSYKLPVRVIIDFSGNDTYNGGNYSLGGTAFGINILLDYDGNDVYRGGNFSLGSSLFGVGILHDFKGNDKYYGLDYTQGSAAFGIGMLIDDGGNDEYHARSHCQGFGSTRGYGVLSDLGGDDTYISENSKKDTSANNQHIFSFAQGCSIGYRPYASGGIGILYDAKGNDKYTGDVYCQGAGYWYGYGGLLDLEGSDTFTGFQYTQGAGIHQGVGILYDEAGNDIYKANGSSQGFGSDEGAGMLLDGKGNDKYLMANHPPDVKQDEYENSVSLLIENNGSNTFAAINNLENDKNYSNLRNKYNFLEANTALFNKNNYCDTTIIDTLTKNFNQSPIHEQNIIVENNIIAMDSAEKADEENEIPVAEDVQDLFIQASADKTRFGSIEDEADTKIINIGDACLLFLADKLGSGDEEEQATLYRVIPEIYKKSPIETKKFLLDSLNSESLITKKICSYFVSQNKLKEGLDTFELWLKDPNWKLRALAIDRITNYGIIDYSQKFKKLLKEENPIVRANAAYGIAYLFPDSVLADLKPAFADSMYIVREAALRGLRENEPIPIDFIIESLTSDLSVSTKKSLATLIPLSNDTKKSAKSFLKIFDQLTPEIREVMYQAITNSSSNFWQNQLKNFYKIETDENLLNLLDTYFKTAASIKHSKKKSN